MIDHVKRQVLMAETSGKDDEGFVAVRIGDLKPILALAETARMRELCESEKRRLARLKDGAA